MTNMNYWFHIMKVCRWANVHLSIEWYGLIYIKIGSWYIEAGSYNFLELTPTPHHA
jgi:hypothetical protein